MRLLVSVRTAAEVAPALAGGADILDAKEPARGSLGPVAPDMLAEILDRVPGNRACSIALGDVSTPEDVASALPPSRLLKRRAEVFLKLGFAGVRSPEVVTRVIEHAADLVEKEPAARLVAVAYADAERAATLAPQLTLQLAHTAGAHGVLLDTHTKDGLGLLGRLSPERLRDWVSSGRRLGLLTALAGELKLADLEVLSKVRPDVIGVRGAACEGGRGGVVTAARVWALRQRLSDLGLGDPGVGETPGSGADSGALTGRNSLGINA
jgi:uncharacterized protein (UPF0264 family)